MEEEVDRIIEYVGDMYSSRNVQVCVQTYIIISTVISMYDKLSVYVAAG